MAVDDLLNEGSELVAHRYQFTLWPRRWREYVRRHAWAIRKLQAAERRHIPHRPGIYTLLVQPRIARHPGCSYLMYVGQAVDLHERFGDYLSKERRDSGRPKIVRLLNLYPDHVWFCYAAAPRRSLDAIEDALSQAYIPPCNDRFPARISKVVRAFP